MTHKPKDETLGQDVDPGNYPHGNYGQVTDPDNEIVSIPKKFVDDVIGFQAALLAAASIAPSGLADNVGGSQMLTAINTLIANAESKFLGVYADIAALQAAHPTANTGATATVTSPDGLLYYWNGAAWTSTGAGYLGDMLASVYDPTAVAADAFSMDSMVETATGKVMTDVERTKLSGIETGATADQTGAEIKAAYEAEADTNAFTDAEKTKLAGVETGATADQTGAEIKAAYEAEANTNAYTDAEKTKLAGLSASGIDTTGENYGASINADGANGAQAGQPVWKDLFGNLNARQAGGTAPAWNAFRGGNVKAYSFGAGEEIQMEFHIPHDYAPGTDLYLHVHWAHNGTAVSGNMIWTYAATYAKGHNQANFPAEVTGTITYNTVNIATTPQYRHRVDEVQFSASVPTASQLDTDDIEVDGVILVNIVASTIPTITGGSPNEPFLISVDIHYQSTHDGTLNKAPAFYT